MLELYIHIKNEVVLCDTKVCIKRKVPALPQVGTHFSLSEEERLLLEQQARKVKLLNGFHPYGLWFYGKSGQKGDENPLLDMKDLSFADAIYVTTVHFDPDSNVHIEFSDSIK